MDRERRMLSGNIEMCNFRLMTEDKRFLPCLFPAEDGEAFCTEHKEERKRRVLQRSRKMLVFRWEKKLREVIVKGFIKSSGKGSTERNIKHYEKNLDTEWNDDKMLLIEGLRYNCIFIE